MITTKEFCKKEYGTSLYKISFDAGFSCPVRDGKIDTRGCIFCSTKGSGDFAVKLYSNSSYCRSSLSCDNPCNNINKSSYSKPLTEDKSYIFNEEIELQIQKAKDKISSKYKGDKYIAYFQAFTNTYSDVATLRSVYMPIIKRGDIAILSIATRPDCLSDEIYDLLSELNAIKPVWVELGLQTTKAETIEYIRRGYDTQVYDKAIRHLNEIGIHTITHMILYLPDESETDMLATLNHVIKVGSKGVKFQLLHVLKGTDLANDFEEKPFHIPSLEEYANMVKKCVDLCGDKIVIHRITGDPPKRLLIEPKFAADKKNVLNTINETINPPSPYYVYIIECEDNSYYTGSTDDVKKRFNKHSNGKGAKYTKAHHPVKLVYVEECKSKRIALKREYEIKHLSRAKKEELLLNNSNQVKMIIKS